MLFQKYEGNPVLGSKTLGTCFDVLVNRFDDRYRMDFSWRKYDSLAVTFSADGVHWDEPAITLPPDVNTGWEDWVNRSCVLLIDGVYRIWYTGQARGHSYIGYAESTDGLHFERKTPEPVLISEYPFEGESVMNPCVLYENGIYRMWYSAGETYEPNVLCYAESTDGLNWKKSRINPIFVHGTKEFEQERIGGCQVIRTEDLGYVMMYIGYRDIDTACICAARSENGITNWERCPGNPLVAPTEGSWDADSCYKPSFMWDEAKGEWVIWYNGRHASDEFIGLAKYQGRDFFSAGASNEA